MNENNEMKTARTIAFDGWVLHAEAGELVKDGRRIRLQQRPLLVLDELLAHPGALVTREQLIARLWPKGVIDFDTGLNTAVRKLRVALDDVGEAPRYIETLPRKGYRFVGTIEPREALPPPGSAPPPRVPARRGSRFALAIVATVAVAGILYFATRESGAQPEGSETALQPAASSDIRVALRPLTTGTSADPDGTLAKIVTDLMRQRLNRLEGVTVIGARALSRTGTEPLEPKRFGATVNSRFVIDGRVTGDLDRVRLAMQIVDVGSGASVWSFDESRAMSDIAGLVDVASRGVARHLGVRADSRARPVAIRPVDLEAYGTYVRANELMETQQIDDGAAALELFRRATVLDPQLANAYLGLAQAITFSAGAGTLTNEDKKKREIESLSASDRALALDPGLGEALIERARLTADSAEADRLYREGLRLAPNYGRGYQRYAEFLFDEYRRGEAREAIERAHVLDPLEPRVTIRLAMFRYLIDGDADAHDELVKEALALNPTMVTGLSQLGLSRWLNGGDVAEGIRLMEEALGLDPDYEEMLNTLATMYLDVDDSAAASAAIGSVSFNISSRVDVALYQREGRRAAQLARATRPEDWIVRWGVPQAWALRGDAMATGDFAPALELMRKRYELTAPWGAPKTGGPQVQNRALGLVYAHTLVLAGESTRGRRLAQTILAQLDGESVGRAPHYLSRDRAAAFAILGEKERAIEELTNSVRIGHLSYWWYYADLDPLFASLHGDPRFDALVTQTKAHRARQRALLDEMRRKGEVPKR